MASNDVIVRLIADVSSLQSGMDRATKELESLKNTTEKSTSAISSTFKKVGTVIAGAFAIDKVKDFTVSMIEATASVNALDSMFEQTFKGDQAKALEGITAQAKLQGINVDRLKGSWASFYGTFRGNGADANESLALTTRYMELAGDGAAYYDLTLEDVVSRLKSITMGNFEAGDAIGININATKMDTIAKEKYNKAWQKLNDTEKEFLLIDTAEEIYKNSGAMGQGAREADNWANVLANLKAVWERLISVIGQPALKIATKSVQALTSKLEVVTDIVKLFKEATLETGWVAGGLATVLDELGFEPLGDIVYNCGLAFNSITESVTETVKWFKEHELVTQALIGVVGGLALAFGGLKLAMAISDAITSMNTGLKNSTKNMQELTKKIKLASTNFSLASIKAGLWNTVSTIGTAVTTAFGTAMAFLTSPITLTVLAIAGLIAVGYLLIKNWETVKTFLLSCWETIKSVATTVWEGIKNTFITIFTAIQTTIVTYWTAFKDFISITLENIRLVITTVWEGIKTFITNVFITIATIISTVMTTIYTIISTVWSAVYTVIEPILNIIKTLIIIVWQGIQMAIALILSVILGAIKLAWEGIKTVITTILDTILNVITTVWEGIKTVITTVLDAISTVVTTIWNSIKDKVMAVLNSILSTVTTIWNNIKTFITNVLNAISSVVSSIWNSIKTFITNTLNAISSTVSSIFNSVKTNVTNIWNNIKSSISSAIEGIKSLVSSGFNWVSSRVQSICNGLRSAVVGIWNGMGSGIQSIVNGIISVVNGMVRALNRISFDVPDWVPIMGGKSFGFSIPTIPSVSWFATGGIIKGSQDGTIVGVGENGGDEAIVPLSNKTRMKPFANAVADFMPDNKGNSSDDEGGGVSINIEKLTVREEADVQKIAQELHKLQERNRRKRGVVYA